MEIPTPEPLLKRFEKWRKRHHTAINRWVVVFVLIVGVCLACILPHLLTAPGSYGRRFFSATTGAIGDTFGGIAGPILNLTGLIIVYFSFEQQLRANRLQQKALKRETDARHQDEAFRDITRSIELFALDIQSHEQSFKALAQVINLILEYQAWQSGTSGYIGRRVLSEPPPLTRNGKKFSGLEGKWSYWAYLVRFTALATHLRFQYEIIDESIENSGMPRAREQNLYSFLRNECVVPTHQWLNHSALMALRRAYTDEFAATAITATVERMRDPAYTPPEVIQPQNLDPFVD